MRALLAAWPQASISSSRSPPTRRCGSSRTGPGRAWRRCPTRHTRSRSGVPACLSPPRCAARWRAAAGRGETCSRRSTKPISRFSPTRCPTIRTRASSHAFRWRWKGCPKRKPPSSPICACSRVGKRSLTRSCFASGPRIGSSVHAPHATRSRDSRSGRSCAGKACRALCSCTRSSTTTCAHAIAVIPDNERFATASEDGTLRIYALDTGDLVDQVMASGELEAVCALPDGRHIAMIARLGAGAGTVVELYDQHERALRPVGRSDAGGFASVCALPNGTLVTGDRDGELTHWDPFRAVRLRRWRQPDDHRGDSVMGLPGREIETVLALPGGQRVASLLAGRWLSVWDVRTGKMEWAAAAQHLRTIALGGTDLVAVELGGSVTFHELDTGAVTREVAIELPGLVTAFALHMPSMTAVWATQIASWRFFFGRAELYAASLADRRVEPVPCGRHDITIKAMAIDAEHSVLVSGSLDGAVRLWDLRRAAQRRDAARHRDRVTAREFFDHHRKLLTASYDGTLRVWRTDSPWLLWRLHRLEGRMESW